MTRFHYVERGLQGVFFSLYYDDIELHTISQKLRSSEKTKERKVKHSKIYPCLDPYKRITKE